MASLGVFLLTPSVQSASVESRIDNHLNPKVANYFLKWHINSSEATQLAQWDVLVLDMETQITSRAQLEQIRDENPDVVMLVYITPQEIRTDAATSGSSMRAALASGISSQWYLQRPNGTWLNNWPGTVALNLTSNAPKVGGEHWRDYLVDFVRDELYDIGLWDGIFYDNAWEGITWFTGTDVDLNDDGRADSNIDATWRAGMEALYAETRQQTDEDFLVVANGHTSGYANQLNGKLTEQFGSHNWQDAMWAYRTNLDTPFTPRISIINENTLNTGDGTDYQQMRYGLTSALLEDGYYSYDFGDTAHEQLWWYDEYDLDLGDAIAEASEQSGTPAYQPGVWRRDFANGLSIVNSTNQSQRVELGGEFEKIHGTQDPGVNDGAIVTSVDLESLDGLLLLKTFESLNDVLFTNGAFLRFFRTDATRVRNGFFVFEDEYGGGVQIAHTDINGNGIRDLVVVQGPKLLAWRDDGQILMKRYPYTASYTGELQIAVGDLNRDRRKEIYVGPASGYTGPIRIYDHNGHLIEPDWYPFGASYTGGVSLAIRDRTFGVRQNELVIGTGVGVRPMVHVYNWQFQLQQQWLAFEETFFGGIDVATGDLDGNGIDEIIVGAGPGKDPLVRIFDPFGNQLYQEIVAYTAFGTPGVDVLSADVDFDGRDDIITSSEGL